MASDVETVDKSNKRFFDIGKRRNEINVAEERSDSKSNHIKLKKRSFTVSIKNSLCGIFKSHKMASTNDDKNNTSTERSCVQISSRCLPPIPFGSSDVDLECQEVPVNELVKQCAILPNENTGLLADDINRDIGNSCTSFINRSPEAIDADDFDSCKYREEPKTGLCTYVDFATNFSKVQDVSMRYIVIYLLYLVFYIIAHFVMPKLARINMKLLFRYAHSEADVRMNFI